MLASSWELVGLVGEEVAHHATDRLRSGVAACHRGVDEVGEPLVAEELTPRGTGLGDAVGVEHETVPGFQAGRPVPRGGGVWRGHRRVGYG